MPKLCRMRLVSIGHESARFSDVTLNFTDRHGRPTNSVLWLRNGGGKTSLLSLFFAGVRPNKREFLGQRADEKIRSIDDYVGPRDHGIVACEWELDADRSPFDEEAPRCLTGVFYQWSTSHEGNGKPGVERLFFGTMVSPSVADLSLEGLPIFAEGETERHRRTLSGFRRRLNQLDAAHPQQNVFHTDKQHKFEEELASRGIDPEVFHYQIHMNEREGGVSERFSFSEDEEFVDFLLEMAFSRRRAQDVRDQLSTFREELMERNEQLKPELEYCQGLMPKLEKLDGVNRERAVLFQEMSTTQQRLVGLKNWVSSRIELLEQQAVQLKERIRSSQASADEARLLADRAHRAAAVFHRHACELRFNAIDAEYQAAVKAHAKAQRLKSIWSAARPLARSWEARRRAKEYRDQLARKRQEYAPDLQRLQRVATELANAIDHRAAEARKEETKLREAAQERTRAATSAQEQAQSAGEAAVKEESQAAALAEKLQTAESELQLLRTAGALADDETAEDGRIRIASEVQSLAIEIAELGSAIRRKTEKKGQLGGLLETARTAERDSKHHLARLKEELSQAEALRSGLKVDAALLRLLQISEVDIEAAAARAISTAGDELRRITDTILRIRIEAAEEERAIDWLQGDGELLPPSRDIEATLVWLRNSGITAWSGWEYIERNVPSHERRGLAERLPFVATGVVVANRDYERVVELSDEQDNVLRLQTALTIVPADAMSDTHSLTWTVIGPTSDGHFDKEAAARELNRLTANARKRADEITSNQSWLEDLTALCEKLRAFQSNYPQGWFARQRQKVEAANAHLEEASSEVERIGERLKEAEKELDRHVDSREECRSRQSTLQRHLDRVEGFIRQYGAHLSQWQRDVATANRSAMKQRANQKRLQEQANKALEQAKKCEAQAQMADRAATDLEAELSQLKHVEDASRQKSAGPIDSLRSDYQMLLNDYERKVDSETLEQLAKDRDDAAEKEHREFQRVLGRFPDLSAGEVEEELSRLPTELSAEERAEHVDAEESAALQRHGTVARQWQPAQERRQEATDNCDELVQSEELPEVALLPSESENQEEAARLTKETDEQLQLAAEFGAEVERLDENLTSVVHESETLLKDGQRLSSIETSHQEQFDRLRRFEGDAGIAPSPPAPPVKDAQDLARQVDAVETSLQDQKGRHRRLDDRRESLSNNVAEWSRQNRFAELSQSISQQFANKRSDQLEEKASFFATQLEDRILEIERKLEEANKHHARVVNVVASAVEEGLGLLKRVSRMSRLPGNLPQGGKHFLTIETKASDSPLERRARVSELIDELLLTGDAGDGLSLVQKAVRRVAVRTKVRVLHPDLHHSTSRMSISELRGKSGGERLTCAILLFCALVRLRHQDGSKKGSNVLLLDNPIGTASRVSFLDLQREVAESMNVQLIYATGVNDLNAVGALENVIRLRNSRVDRRTGRRIVELEGDGEWPGEIDAARVVFDSPAGSVVGTRDGSMVVDGEIEENVEHPRT